MLARLYNGRMRNAVELALFAALVAFLVWVPMPFGLPAKLHSRADSAAAPDLLRASLLHASASGR